MNTSMKGGLLKPGFNTTKFIGSIILGLLFIGIAMFTQARGSVLELTTPQHEGVIVELNNKRYYSDCLLTIRGLKSGQHRLKVFNKTRSRTRCGNGRKVRLLYNGVINLPHRSKMEATVHPIQGLCIDNVTPLGRTMHQPQVYYPEYDQYGNYDNGFPGYSNHGNTWNTHHAPVLSPGDDHQTGSCGVGMNTINNREFQEILNRMEDRAFDSDRLRLAKRAVTNYNLNSHQVRAIMLHLCFDSTRLDFAKFAYNSVVDPHRYHVTYDAFDFRSSERELEEFLFI